MNKQAFVVHTMGIVSEISTRRLVGNPCTQEELEKLIGNDEYSCLRADVISKFLTQKIKAANLANYIGNEFDKMAGSNDEKGGQNG